MNSFSGSLLESDVKFAIGLHAVMKWTKYGLATVLLTVYFLESKYLIDVIVFSIAVSLFFPLSFFGLFIQKLLEYNTQMVEARLMLNANETNEALNQILEKVE